MSIRTMSIRTKIGLIAILTITLAIILLAWLQRERIAFVGKCWGNGNNFGACHCTYNALPELPDNYRDLAVSWAHTSGTAYAAGVAYLVAAETWRVGAKQLRQTADISDKGKILRRGMRMIAEKIGWLALQQMAPAAASVLGPVAAAAPLVSDAVNELATAQRVLGRHCGTGETFIVRLNERIQAVAQLLD